MIKTLFGTMPSREEIYKFRLESECASAEIISLGATIASFMPYGKEIIGGFDTLEEYLDCSSYHGATVGRVCNRIVGASFEMDGVLYELTKNNDGHCLHGGNDAYHDKPWDVIDYGADFVRLGYTSPDGQSGFPGEVKIEAKFSLSGDSLAVEYTAVPNNKTPIMITTHGFFNLDSFVNSVEEHRVRIYADEYSEVSEARLPTGRRVSVAGGAFDFRTPKTIAEGMKLIPIGYDHNFVVKPEIFIEYGEKSLGLCAEVWGKELKLSAYTDQPGFQFYVLANNKLTEPPLRGGVKQTRMSSFCIEPQIEPNCVARGVGFIDAGEVYTNTIIYKVERI